MELNTIKNILNAMLVSLNEFKSEDVIYYEKQVLKIINHIKKLENQNN
tara:strand:- start:324 stop:467 length:144 start_codon:yes stop_codon:yes gene_type:complete